MTSEGNDFKVIVAALAERAEDLCNELLAGGKRSGHTWVAGNVAGDKGKSLVVELSGPKAGRWQDYGGGDDEKGDLLDLIRLHFAFSDVKAAADWARSWLGMPAFTVDKSAPKAFNPLKKGFKKEGELQWRYPVKAWAYRDENGKVIGYVCRFEDADGGKDTIPMRLDENGEWKWRGWPAEGKQKPIYNLHKLKKRPNDPVLIVEGEKTCDAAEKLFPACVCITWQGGCKTPAFVDWTPVIERKTRIFLWPDADAPGRKAMAYLKALRPDAGVVATNELQDGWDVADPCPDGVSLQGLLDAAGYQVMDANAKPDELAAEQAAKEIQEPVYELNDAYVLPEGVDADVVARDVKKYGMFFHDNWMWAMRTKEDKKDGEVVTIYYFKKVGNFSMEVLYHVRDRRNPMRVMRMVNEDKEEYTFETGSISFSSASMFKGVLETFGNFHFTGTTGDFDRLKTKLMKEMGKARLVHILGWHHDGLFIFNNMAVNGELLPVNEHGLLQHKGKMYYLPSANTINHEGDQDYETQRRMLYIDSGLTFEKVAHQVHRVHGHHAKVMLLYAIACLFRDFIYKHCQFFPIIYLYGPPSSGKTRLIRACQSFYGLPQSSMTITGKASTDKARIRKLAQNRNTFGHMAEYKNDIPTDSKMMLSGFWDGFGYEKANILGAMTTETVPINSGVVIDGNDVMDFDTLYTRVVECRMMQTDYSPEEKRNYDVLGEMLRKGFSSIVVDFVKHRKAFEEQWDECYSKAKVDANHMLALEPGIVARMIENVAVLIAVYRFFQDKVKFPFTLEQLHAHLKEAMKLQNGSRDTGGEVSKFWDCFKMAVRDGQLLAGRDYRMDGDAFVIVWGPVHSVYLTQHWQLYKSAGKQKSTMSDLLKKSPAWDKYRDNDVRMEGGRKVSGFQFKLTQLGRDFMQDLEMNTQAGKTSKKSRKRRKDQEGGDTSDGGTDDLPF